MLNFKISVLLLIFGRGVVLWWGVFEKLGDFCVWMKSENGVCFDILINVVCFFGVWCKCCFINVVGSCDVDVCFGLIVCFRVLMFCVVLFFCLELFNIWYV